MNVTKCSKSNINMPKATQNRGLFVYDGGHNEYADWFLANICQQFETSLNTIPRNPG